MNCRVQVTNSAIRTVVNRSKVWTQNSIPKLYSKILLKRETTELADTAAESLNLRLLSGGETLETWNRLGTVRLAMSLNESCGKKAGILKLLELLNWEVDSFGVRNERNVCMCFVPNDWGPNGRSDAENLRLYKVLEFKLAKRVQNL